MVQWSNVLAGWFMMVPVHYDVSLVMCSNGLGVGA